MVAQPDPVYREPRTSSLADAGAVADEMARFRRESKRFEHFGFLVKTTVAEGTDERIAQEAFAIALDSLPRPRQARQLPELRP